MGDGSNQEIALRVVGGLMWMAAGRHERMVSLSDVVHRAVDELDPLHERDSAPTYYRDLPAWVRLDGFDRLRQAFDNLDLVEQSSRAEIAELRKHLRWGHSLVVLGSMGLACRGYLDQMRRAERSPQVHDGLAAATSAELRRMVREMLAAEELMERERAKLVLVASAAAPTLAVARAG